MSGSTSAPAATSTRPAIGSRPRPSPTGCSADRGWSATAGRFINSDNAHSSYVGAYYQPWSVSGIQLGVVGGAFNGYPKAFSGGWFPAVLPVATWEGSRFGLNLALVPPLKDRLYGALSFQLKVRLP